jgi:AraC-like DNA-binding protein
LWQLMSQKRQGAVFEALTDRRSQIMSLRHDYAAGHVIPLHFHNRDQLVYASRGVMTVRTEDSAWVVPTHRAVWIPASVAHTVAMSGAVAMRTLYLRARLAEGLPRDCCVVNVLPLLRELVLHVCAIGSLKKTNKRQHHLMLLILDQLEASPRIPLQLRNPSDPRAVRVAAALLANPGDRRPLAQICKSCGASKRTIERLFQADVGMTFSKWRQQLRLMQAMRLLAEGAKVTHAALESGYSTPSAFICMFKKALGTTPAAYFAADTAEHGLMSN